MAPTFCAPEAHDYLRAHPELLLRLRPWRDLEQDIGECPVCGTTLNIDWTPERRAELQGAREAA